MIRYSPRNHKNYRRKNKTRFDAAISFNRGMVVRDWSLPWYLRVQVLLGVVLLVGAIALGSWFVGDAWRINHVRVANATNLPTEDIIVASRLNGQHSQFVDVSLVAKRIDNLPGVEGVKVTCNWDGSCDILVNEASLLAVWQQEGGSLSVNQRGEVQVLPKEKLANADNLLQIGNASHSANGAVLSTEKPIDSDVLDSLFVLQNLQSEFTNLSYNKEYGFMADWNGYTLRLGTENYPGALRERLGLAQSLHVMLSSRDIAVKVLDVRFVDAPFYIQDATTSADPSA